MTRSLPLRVLNLTSSNTIDGPPNPSYNFCTRNSSINAQDKEPICTGRYPEPSSGTAALNLESAMQKHFLVFAVLTLMSVNVIPALAQSPAGTTTPDPAGVERRVEALLSQMTLEEKIDLLGGVDGFYIRGMSRIGWPRLKMADGPIGVRNYGPATAMAAGISLAATWNAALAERVGTEIGRDARAKGVHFLLAPGVNIYRAPMNGRNFEYFGEDPFLASRIAVGYIKGVQGQGVSATVKHFMGNNSEFDRHNTDSVIDERTMREIYLPV